MTDISWAEAIERKYGNQIAQLLGLKTTNVTFRFGDVGNNAGETNGTVVTLSPSWFKKHPDDIGAVVHEITHAYMQAPGYGSAQKTWLIEGLADYARDELVQDKSDSSQAAHSGYQGTAAFIQYLEKEQPGAAKFLAQSLANGTYDPSIFKQHFGIGVAGAIDSYEEGDRLDTTRQGEHMTMRERITSEIDRVAGQYGGDIPQFGKILKALAWTESGFDVHNRDGFRFGLFGLDEKELDHFGLSAGDWKGQIEAAAVIFSSQLAENGYDMKQTIQDFGGYHVARRREGGYLVLDAADNYTNKVLGAAGTRAWQSTTTQGGGGDGGPDGNTDGYNDNGTYRDALFDKNTSQKEINLILQGYGIPNGAFSDLIDTAIRQGWTESEFTAHVYASPQFHHMFPGIFREDGSMRMSPLEYRQLSADYQHLSEQYGLGKLDKSRIGNLIGGDTSVDELQTRFEAIKRIDEYKPAFNEFKQVLESRGIEHGNLKTEEGMLDFTLGLAPKKFYDVWEETQVGTAARTAEVRLKQGMIKRIARGLPGYQSEGDVQASFAELADRISTTMPASAYGKFGLTKADLASLQFGLKAGKKSRFKDRASIAAAAKQALANYEAADAQRGNVQAGLNDQGGFSTYGQSYGGKTNTAAG